MPIDDLSMVYMKSARKNQGSSGIIALSIDVQIKIEK